jgi:hypothetical protein
MLTTEQLAARWGIAPKTLRNWRHTGGGPRAVKHGTARGAPVRYPLAEVERWETDHLETRTHEPVR